MQHPHSTARFLGATVLALSLAACRGQGGNDTLADGAVDRPTANNGSTGVGPGAPPVDSAGPGEGNSASMSAASPQGAPSGATTLTLAQGAKGPYLTNSAGNAMYFVEGDTDGGKCTGPCLQTWPPVTVTDQLPMGAAGLQGAKIATITRADGARQVTFEGHPLYRYAADAGAGQANGDGLKDKFGTWHLAAPSAAVAPAGPSGAAANGTGSATAAPASGGKTPG
ncbi:COG4315 family predicted lipoprotein [Lysobacter xanthus]